MKKPTDIIARMEAMQQRFGAHPLQLMQRTVFPSILQSAEDECRERNKDLEHESRVDYSSWELDADDWAEASERQGAE